MVYKITLTLCFLLLLGVLCAEAQRDGRRRSGRRKPTTESPQLMDETESEKNSQNLDAEPEAIAKSSSAQPTESETKSETPSADKESANNNQNGKPFIVPRGTRKPRPQMRSNGEPRPKPTLPTFSRKRGPKPERHDFKRNDENSLASSSTSTTQKPSRGSSRNRNSNNSHDRNSDAEKASHAANSAEISTEAVPKKRFGGGPRRGPSRGNRRHNATMAPES